MFLVKQYVQFIMTTYQTNKTINALVIVLSVILTGFLLGGVTDIFLRLFGFLRKSANSSKRWRV